MFRTVMVSLATALLAAGAPAQDFKKTEEKKAESLPSKSSPGEKASAPSVKAVGEVGVPGEVEINFLNGSTVRMILQSDKLEIATPYGPLAVPSTEIRAIDFGLHFPDGVDVRIKEAVKNLGGGSNFRDRDQATKALMELGPYSYPAAFEASRSGDPEVARRAKDIVKQLQAKHPKKDLKTSAEDRVITPTFTIVGRILTPTLKAKAELFGDVTLPVARMRGLRSFAGAGQEVDVVIDASKYANVGQWLETDFKVDGRSTLVITARGQVDTWPQQGGQFIVGPNGLQGRNGGQQIMLVAGRKLAGAINGHTYGGALLGKVGEDGVPFTIGEHYEGTLDTQGKLFLHIGPSPWNAQSSGSYEVKIARKH
jgi:hypothetical protein